MTHKNIIYKKDGIGKEYNLEGKLLYKGQYHEGERKLHVAAPRAPEQLWRIDQLTDGTFRIMPKEVPGHSEPLALVSFGDSSATLAKFDFHSDNCKWDFKRFSAIK